MLLTWLDADESARLIVDDQLRISWANGTARRWISERFPIAAVKERLCLGDSTLMLRALLTRAALKPEGTCIPVANGTTHLIICARRIGAHGARSMFGIHVRRTDRPPVEAPVGVAEAFRLTASEVRVLEQLCRGATAQETAVELSLSLETIRTHIKRLYQKVGVGSREALLSQLRPFMMTL
jgi:DNA-binding CsgD family transcriptional regulator